MQSQPKAVTSTKNNASKQEDKAPEYLYAYRFQYLQDYFAGDLSDKGALLLEYLIMIGALWLKKKRSRFFHSKATIKKRTGISPNTATTLIKDFEDYGFLVTEVVHEHGRPITYFRMNFGRIASSLGVLFGDEEVEHSPEQLERIEQRQLALKHLARLQVELKQRERKLLAK